MAKIRGIKPEFWTDEDIVELGIPARLFFIGLWNFACDNGHVEDKPRQLKMRILPADDVSAEALLKELVEKGRIERENGVITIPKFAQHQKPHSRWWAVCDVPGCVKPDGSTTVVKGPSKPINNGGATVDNRSPRRTTAVVDGDGDGDGDGEVSSPRAIGIDEFERWWATYPKKVGKGQARKAYHAALRKTTALTLLSSLTKQLPALTRRGDEFTPHPTTWLNGERWTDESTAHRGGSGDSADWMRRKPS